MPTLEILNLATLYFALPRMSTAPQTPNPPPPAYMLTQPLWIRPLCEVVHEVHAIKIHFHHCNDENNNLCRFQNTCKNVLETVQ